jgi:serine/threonine protein kinase
MTTHRNVVADLMSAEPSPTTVEANEAAAELQRQPDFHGFQFLECESQTPLMQVWRARRPDGALKWLKLVSGLAHRHVLSPEELKRAAHLKFIRHPRLLPYEEVESEQGRLVVVMPWAEFTLRHRYQECIQSGLPGVPRNELLFYLQAAAEGLDFLERQESLHHLSLHPAALVVMDGDVRLADYGLVELAWKPAGQPLDITGLRYAAPELFDNQFTKTSDQYSLALIYCEMLTGRLPFAGTMLKQMREQRLTGEPDLQLVPKHDAIVLAQALQKDPQRRFETLLQFATALRNAAPGQTDAVRRRGPGALATPQSDPDLLGNYYSALEVERVVNQLIQLAAFSTVVKEQGGMRYYLDMEENQLTHRCAAWLPPGMAWQKLQGFAHQWQATLAQTGEDELIYQIELPQNFWRRFVRAEPDFLEVVVNLVSPRKNESKLTEATITVRYRGHQADEGRAAVQKLGPTLLYSLRSYLLATAEHRLQERFNFDYPLWVYPYYAGQYGEGMSCHGKNVSRHGIGFLAPYRLPTKDVHLQIITSELGALNVPATILRTHQLPDGQFEIGARFKMPASAAVQVF